MGVDFSFQAIKNSFFDTDAIVAQVKKDFRRTAGRFGAFARRRMKSSLKYREGKSSPGSPPNVHRSRGYTRPKKGKDGTVSRQPVSPLRELIFFAYDRDTESVVVGPVKFGGKGGIAPGLLEHGGGGTFKASRTGEIKRGVWAPRPFVKPAGDAEATAGKFLVG